MRLSAKDDRYSIPLDVVRNLLSYDPEEGIFRWRTTGKGRRMDGTVGEVTGNGYLRVTIRGKKYLAHRLAWFYVHGEWPNGDVDHANLDKMDNRIDNLRIATPAQNMANTRTFSHNKSGFKGVRLRTDHHKRRKPYEATIYVAGKPKYLGTYATPEEAHAAYVVAANENFGEFARAA